MGTEYVHEGGAVDYTPGSDVESGAVVVQGELVGVTKRSIKNGELGALHVKGVFDFPKATAGGSAIAVGAKVYWDEADSEAKEDAEAGANKFIGKTILDAGDDDETVRVRLSQ